MQGIPSVLNSSFNMAAMANGGGGVLKRQALSLKNDPDGNGKYIAGLKDVRVRTREVSQFNLRHALAKLKSLPCRRLLRSSDLARMLGKCSVPLRTENPAAAMAFSPSRSSVSTMALPRIPVPLRSPDSLLSISLALRGIRTRILLAIG